MSREVLKNTEQQNKHYHFAIQQLVSWFKAKETNTCYLGLGNKYLHWSKLAGPFHVGNVRPCLLWAAYPKPRDSLCVTKRSGMTSWDGVQHQCKYQAELLNCLLCPRISTPSMALLGRKWPGKDRVQCKFLGHGTHSSGPELSFLYLWGTLARNQSLNFRIYNIKLIYMALTHQRCYRLLYMGKHMSNISYKAYTDSSLSFITYKW